MNCAIIDATGKIVNVIVADPIKDDAPSGHTLAEAPTGCRIGWTWTAASGFKISAAEEAALQAAITALNAQAYDVTVWP